MHIILIVIISPLFFICVFLFISHVVIKHDKKKKYRINKKYFYIFLKEVKKYGLYNEYISYINHYEVHNINDIILDCDFYFLKDFRCFISELFLDKYKFRFREWELLLDICHDLNHGKYIKY